MEINIFEAGRLLRCSKRNRSETKETCHRHEKRILIKTMNPKYRDVVGGDRPYLLSEFHLVDLETNEIQLSYLPPLLNCASHGVMVALDHVVYNLGGLLHFVVEGSHFKLLKSNSPQSEKKYYLGGSYFDLGKQSQGGEWGPTPASIKHSKYILCTTLFGKIYALGSLVLAPEVFDPTVGHWKTLNVAPRELEGASLSVYLLPDPSNNCILVHFSHPKPTLYAFTPPTDDDDTHSSGGSWKCLVPKFPYWTHVATVVDGVLFLYSPTFASCLRVFDIAHKTWLKVCWTKSFGNGFDMNEAKIDFDALLPLSDKILCLAIWSPKYDLDNKPVNETQVMFAKFIVERIGDTVNLIPLSTHTHLLPDTNDVTQFLPVS